MPLRRCSAPPLLRLTPLRPAQEQLRKVAVPSPQYAQKEFAGWVDNEQREGRGDFGEMGVEGPDSKSNAFLASLGMKGVGGMGHTRRAAGAHAPPPPAARVSVSSKHCCLEFPSGNAPRESFATPREPLHA